MKKSLTKALLLISTLLALNGYANIIHIPTDYAAIQDGVNAAVTGDTVLIAPGTYFESVVLENKTITLASHMLTTGNSNFITQTIIDGGYARSTILIQPSVGAETTVMGLTIQHGKDGVTPYAHFNLLNNLIILNTDGVDYESGSGGICRDNIFEFNEDDGIDLDEDVDIIIERNIIRHNDDDGIEIRLHPYSGPLLNYTIRNNVIYDNDEDGIQLIDYSDISDRVFYIHHNIIFGNAQVGVGCMGNGDTQENYEGYSIPEPIYLYNNTIAGNYYGVTGGDNHFAINNLIINNTIVGMKNVDGNSVVSYSNMWNNGSDFDNCNIDNANIMTVDPMVDSNYELINGSPCIDAGVKTFQWNNATILDLPQSEFYGSAPDIGGFEFGSVSSTESDNEIGHPEGFNLLQNYPNPFNPSTTIRFQIFKPAFTTLKIFNLVGQAVNVLVEKNQQAGEYQVSWNGKNSLGTEMPTGVYLYRLNSGELQQTKKMYLIR